MTIFETIKFLLSGDLHPEILPEEKKQVEKIQDLPPENPGLKRMKSHFQQIIPEKIPVYKCFRLTGELKSGSRKIPYDFIIPYEKCGVDRQKIINYCISCCIRAVNTGYKEIKKYDPKA